MSFLTTFYTYSKDLFISVELMLYNLGNHFYLVATINTSSLSIII